MKYYCNTCEETFESQQSEATQVIAEGELKGLIRVQCPRCGAHGDRDIVATEAMHNASDDDYTNWGCFSCEHYGCDDCSEICPDDDYELYDEDYVDEDPPDDDPPDEMNDMAMNQT